MATDKINYDSAIAAALVPTEPAFINEGGHNLAGILIDRYNVEGQYGLYPVLEVEAAQGKFSLEIDAPTVDAEPGTVYAAHMFRQIAKGEVERVDPRIGDAIVIAHAGIKESRQPGHDPMHIVKVKIVKRAVGETQAPVRSTPKQEALDVPF
jgi:hypothetical protein